VSRVEIIRFTCDTKGCDQMLEFDRTTLQPTVAGPRVTEGEILDDHKWGRVSSENRHSVLCGAHMADFRKFFPEPEATPA